MGGFFEKDIYKLEMGGFIKVSQIYGLGLDEQRVKMVELRRSGLSSFRQFEWILVLFGEVSDELY